MSILTLQSTRNYTKVYFYTFISPFKKQSDPWTCERLHFMRRSVSVIISAMKFVCGVLYRNCTAIKSTFHRAMKRNRRNSDCKGEVTSRNILRIRVSNPYILCSIIYGQTDRLYPENGFQGAVKRQGGPFLGFAQVFSAIFVRNRTARTGY